MNTMKTAATSPITRSLTLVLLLAAGPLAGCSVASGEAETVGEASREAVGEASSAVFFGDCSRSYMMCTSRCQRLALRGVDTSQCESDCGASLNSCHCDVSPYECVGE